MSIFVKFQQKNTWDDLKSTRKYLLSRGRVANDLAPDEKELAVHAYMQSSSKRWRWVAWCPLLVCATYCSPQGRDLHIKSVIHAFEEYGGICSHLGSPHICPEEGEGEPSVHHTPCISRHLSGSHREMPYKFGKNPKALICASVAKAARNVSTSTWGSRFVISRFSSHLYNSIWSFLLQRDLTIRAIKE